METGMKEDNNRENMGIAIPKMTLLDEGMNKHPGFIFYK